MARPHHTNLFIISGPSGAGEDSIIDGLRERLPIDVAVTTTTRDMRPGESQGHPYYFTDIAAFERMIADGALAEWARHYNGNYYGVTHAEIDRIRSGKKVGIWKVDYKGVIAAKKLFPDVVAIFVMADSLEELERRIRARSDVTDAYVAERMAYTRQWLDHTDIYDYTVLNRRGQLGDAVTHAELIIRSHSDR